ncbi:MAG: pentapeptide repeat-containing protein [Bdellovibrionales bacterium]|nr:pentapeptide repeat-containing protein [Bdellovibrionales bacterium]
MSYFEEMEFKNELRVDLEDGAEFLDCVFESINFEAVNLSNLKILDCTFKNCNLSNVKLLNSSIRGSSFVDSKIVGVNFSNCLTVQLLSFSSSILNYSVFQDLDCVSFDFQACSLKEVDFSDSRLHEASFTECDLTLANFSGSDLRKADFRRAIGYQIDPVLTKIKGAKFSAPEVLGLLTSFEINIS